MTVIIIAILVSIVAIVVAAAWVILTLNPDSTTLVVIQSFFATVMNGLSAALGYVVGGNRNNGNGSS